MIFLIRSNDFMIIILAEHIIYESIITPVAGNSSTSAWSMDFRPGTRDCVMAANIYQQKTSEILSKYSRHLPTSYTRE